MRLLIYSSDNLCAQWVKDTLNEFGRGMHISIALASDPEMLNAKWAYIILLGDVRVPVLPGMPHIHFPLFAGHEEQEAMRRKLWLLYRDTIYDMIGSKCSCGMYDVCHCH